VFICFRTEYYSPWWKFWNVEKQVYYRVSFGRPIDHVYSDEELEDLMTYRPIEELKSHFPHLLG
jgi:hypothetical protein